MDPSLVKPYDPHILFGRYLQLGVWVPKFDTDPCASESFCRYCLRELPTSCFWWSNRKQRWTTVCRECTRDHHGMRHDEGKDYFRSVEILQRALDHNQVLLNSVSMQIQRVRGRAADHQELRLLCERFILLDERCLLISNKRDEVAFLQAALEAEDATI